MVVRISVLLDSSVIIAFHNKDDENHLKAVRIMNDIVKGKFGRPYISDYVFGECLTVALLKLNFKEAVNLGKHLISSEISLLKSAAIIVQRAWEIFQEKNTGKLSFTDCTNIAFMEILSIDYLATFDNEFRKISGLNIIGLE